ncbi:MAG: cell division protein SepF [Candidatus Altiarchaeota archaeon]|nr:cell division protein SepF [Candidatus Altiarchaeota archaeon]
MGIIDELIKGDDAHVVQAKVIHTQNAKLKLDLMVMERYNDVEKVLNKFRSGDRIIIVKVSPLRDKDMTELKKAINRMKTHCNVTGADLAALDDSWIILVPPIVQIEK